MSRLINRLADARPHIAVVILADVLLIALILLIYAGCLGFLTTPRTTGTQPAPAVSVPAESSVSLSEKFADRFSDRVIITDHSYKSPNISVEISDTSELINGRPQHWYLTDIYVSDVHLLQSRLSGDKLQSSSSSILDMSADSNAVVSVNGDYAGIASSGVVIRNGELYRDAVFSYPVAFLYEDGRLVCRDTADYGGEQALEDGAWQAWDFGPSLLDENGKALSDFGSYPKQISDSRNPRTALGYYEPGHYCFVTVDGRHPTVADGVTLGELAAMMEKLGCTAAYNLDGGQSSMLYFNGKIHNDPDRGGRLLCDILLVTDATEEAEK